MICSNYDLLTHREKIEFVGKIVHCIQSDNRLFVIGESIIRQAEEWGILDDVIINPDREPDTE